MNTYLYRISLLLTAMLIAGCAWTGRRAEQQDNVPVSRDFAAVVVQPEDTLPLLAAKYLNDPSLDWIIEEFNDIPAIYPGQKLIIPLKPYNKGGLHPTGYQTVPVLAYNNFSDTRANKTTISKSAFEKQMMFLKNKGYRVITIKQLFNFLNHKDQIPKKSVVITIDNGWRSVYEIVFPILKKYGYPATLFIYTDLIGKTENALSWELLRELAERGLDIQCNTKTFRSLTVIKKKESFKEYFEAISRELSECSETIKKEIGREVEYLAYPYGETNHLIIAMLKKHGYKGAFTVKRESNPFFINNYKVSRSMIYGNFDLKEFEKNLTVFKKATTDFAD